MIQMPMIRSKVKDQDTDLGEAGYWRMEHMVYDVDATGTKERFSFTEI